MNELFSAWGISGWKPWLEMLLLSPLPWFALAFGGAWRLRRQRRGGAAALTAGLIVLWAMSTSWVGWTLIESLTRPPPPLDEAGIARLARAPRTAILVLGAGRHFAPEYGDAEPRPLTLERLRYGLWLARRTGLPVGYSGGIGWASLPGPTEGEVARTVAARDFGVRLRWVEDRSRDTAENARYSVALLHAAGIDRVVLVTHGFHLQRARAAFEREATRQHVAMTLIGAGVGLRESGEPPDLGDFLPGPAGLQLTMLALHEWVGWLAGA
jgi:uncharacterized SAM-binding protein YcdF (DUF218 family)